MAEQILIAIMGVGVTVVIAVVGAIYRKLDQNIEPVLIRLRVGMWGDPETRDGGLVEQVENVETELQREKQHRRQEHNEVSTKVDNISDVTKQLANGLKESETVDVDVSVDNINGDKNDD